MSKTSKVRILKARMKYRDSFLRSTPRCTLNTLANYMERGIQRTVPWSYPKILQVDVTNRCNLNCIFCSRYVHSLKLGDMPADLVPAIGRISEHSLETILTGYGEPLMADVFFPLLKSVRSSRVSFITNGLALTNSVLERVLSCAQRPLYNISVSVDGARPTTYNSIRERSDFRQVWANVENMTRVGTGYATPFETWINFVAMRRNVAELPELVRQAAEIGVSKIVVFHLVVWHDRFRDESLLADPALNREAFTAAEEAAASCGILLDLPLAFPVDEGERREAVDRAGTFPACHQPWSYVFVRQDGSVHACCFSESFVMGNLRTDSFEEIWKGKRYRSFRGIVNRKLPADCLRCEMRFRYQESPDDRNVYLKLKPRTM